jgi:hypothetical protein
MIDSKVADMVDVMNTMLDNMERLLEEMRSLQKDIRNKIEESDEGPAEALNLKQEKRLQKRKVSVPGKRP